MKKLSIVAVILTALVSCKKETKTVTQIDPKTGEVIAKFDFSQLTKQNTKGEDDVLNGIAFKGNNMLVTGKNWSKIYEVKIE